MNTITSVFENKLFTNSQKLHFTKIKRQKIREKKDVLDTLKEILPAIISLAWANLKHQHQLKIFQGISYKLTKDVIITFFKTMPRRRFRILSNI